MAGTHAEHERLEQRRGQRSEARTQQTYMKFIRDVAERGDLSPERAELAAQSVLCVLEQRLIGGQVAHLEAQLPAKLRELLQGCPRHEGAPDKKFHRAEMLRRVGEAFGCSDAEAEPLIRAVCQVLREHVTEGEAKHVEDELPDDLRDLFRPAS